MKRQSVINRILLASAGIVLLAGGLLVLAGGLDLYRSRHLTPPDRWPLVTPDAVLLSAADRTRWTDEGWWWAVVIAALAVIVLLALWWLLEQLRRTRPGRMSIGTPPTDGVELHDHALSDAIAADARQLPGVQQARAQMTGRANHPEARITLMLTPGTEPGSVLHALCHGPLERARQSTGWAHLPTQVRLQVTIHKPHRAE
ncbi:alkaline shock response membrane anchor protein AmaP [Streptomyces sp. NPDC058646]|uniref:alkaline shock response membrane anchor protein AmaP n=1 Tax=Streptomyces sp. NPDC058646 TaxID=3346574 RepID=UPI0036489EB3